MLVQNNNNSGHATNDVADMMRRMEVEDFAEENNIDFDAHDNAQFERVSKMYISENTREGYQSCMKRLLLFLDDSNPECVSDYAKTALQDAFPEGATVKHKNKAVIACALQLIVAANDTSKPIIFEAVTVKIFVKFLFTMARKNTDGNTFLSKSGCGSYRSAFKDLYRQCKVSVPPAFEAELTTQFKGLLRARAEEKEAKGSRLSEGKDPMPFALYKRLCAKMMADGSKDAIFAHAFLALTWNLVCRSKNTVFIHRNHISWDHDALSIQFAHMKTDMAGEDAKHKRHIYANPHCLHICAVTALAKYLAVFQAKDDNMLFDKNSYGRFGKYLGNLVKDSKLEMEQLGIKVEDIGVHSIRKGAATYCCGGTTAAPHIAAVCNRAGWTMGKVKDTYIQYAAAGDQHVGRVVSGLPVLSVKYACTPPYIRIKSTDHNNKPNDEEAENVCHLDDLTSVIGVLFPCQITTEFRPVAIACAAALFFAKEYIHSLQPLTTSVIRMTNLFSCYGEVMKRAQKSVKISYLWQECHYWEVGSLTGIPPHIVTFVNQERILKRLDEGFAHSIAELRADLDKRQLGGGTLNMEILQERILKPIEDKMASLDKFIHARVEGPNNSERGSVNQISGGRIEVTSDHFFFWSTTGTVPHLLPENFTLDASIPTLTLWHRWHRGLTDASGRLIAPLKDVSCKDYPVKKNQRIFKRMKHFCSAIDEKLNVSGEEGIANLTTIFNANLEVLMNEGLLLSDHTSTGRKRTRQSELGWNYIADRWETMARYKKTAAEEELQIEEVIIRKEQKVKDRQRRNREIRKTQRLAEEQRRAAGTTNIASRPREDAGIGGIAQMLVPGLRDSASRLLN